MPCRVCGEEHTNPASSSICRPCGMKERERREWEELAERNAYEEGPFGQFMAMSEDERWRHVFERLQELESC